LGLTTFGNAQEIPYLNTGDGELILYDYNVGVGDKYPTAEGYDEISVLEKDTLWLLDGKSHRRLTLSNGLILIEGIGCVNSPGLVFDYLNPRHPQCFAWLESYSVVDTTIYQQSTWNFWDDKRADLDNPHFDSTDAMRRVPIYNLQGRRLMAKPARGLYIEQGRKHIAW